MPAIEGIQPVRGRQRGTAELGATQSSAPNRATHRRSLVCKAGPVNACSKACHCASSSTKRRRSANLAWFGSRHPASRELADVLVAGARGFLQQRGAWPLALRPDTLGLGHVDAAHFGFAPEDAGRRCGSTSDIIRSNLSSNSIRSCSTGGRGAVTMGQNRRTALRLLGECLFRPAVPPPAVDRCSTACLRQAGAACFPPHHLDVAAVMPPERFCDHGRRAAGAGAGRCALTPHSAWGRWRRAGGQRHLPGCSHCNRAAAGTLLLAGGVDFSGG